MDTILDWIILLVVPLLTVVVLGTLLVTSVGYHGTFAQRTTAAASVVLVGPMVMLLLGSAASRAADEPSRPNEAIPSENVANRSSIEDLSSPAVEATDEVSQSLSISPADSHQPLVTYPADRPQWVDAEPSREGPERRSYVSSGEQVSRKECLAALDVELVNHTNTYINEYLGSDDASKHVHYDLAYIKTHLVDPDPSYQYAGPVHHQWGDMYDEHRVLVFDKSFRDELGVRWEEARVRSRLMCVAVAAFGMLGLLGTICGYFRLDNATRGFYSGRLQFAALTAILMMIATGVFVARWVPWI